MITKKSDKWCTDAYKSLCNHSINDINWIKRHHLADDCESSPTPKILSHSLSRSHTLSLSFYLLNKIIVFCRMIDYWMNLVWKSHLSSHFMCMFTLYIAEQLRIHKIGVDWAFRKFVDLLSLTWDCSSEMTLELVVRWSHFLFSATWINTIINLDNSKW